MKSFSVPMQAVVLGAALAVTTGGLQAKTFKWTSASDIPTWDISHKFGTTNLLVTSMDMGRDLAASLGPRTVALMRGHGFVCVGRSINDLVRLSVFIPRNARVMMNAMRMGEFVSLSRGEVEARLKLDTESPALLRGWEYWAKEAGVGHLVGDIGLAD